jgi:hypothetical protein
MDSNDADVRRATGLLQVVVGEQLVQFRMGYGVHLELGSDAEVTIETPFRVTTVEDEWTGEPLTEGAAGALLPLILQKVTSAEVTPDDALRLGVGPSELMVRPHPDFEAWQLRSTNGLLVVCMPGGGLAIWDSAE